MIEGGFYLKARKIQESAIMHAPPHVREIWDWLLLKAMWKDGDWLERGQVLTSYQEIRDGLSWRIGYRTERYSKWDCEKAMKWLTKEQMVTTAKTTRGLIITVLHYSLYQNPDNYESHNVSHKRATMKPQTPATIEKKEEESKKGKKEKHIYGSFVELSDDEHQKLTAQFNSRLPGIIDTINFKIESKGLPAWRKDHKSDYATILYWDKMGWLTAKEGELPQKQKPKEKWQQALDGEI